MIDLVLDGNVTPEDLRTFLCSAVAKIEKDAVVRVKCAEEPDERIKKMLTSSFLRDIFPETMNFQLSSALYTSYRKPGK